MADNASPSIVRQYFEHPPRSHLYRGSPTGASLILSGSPTDAIPGRRKTGECDGIDAGEGDAAGSSTRRPSQDGTSGLREAGEGAGEESGDADPRRALSTLLLTGLMYTVTISGAYGIEESVMGGGVMLTIISVVVIPVVVGGPTALVVAELASAVPSNAGFLMWIKLSFHRTVYFAMAILSLFYIATDNALYPTMFSEYTCTAVECSTAGAISLRLGMLTLTFLLNMFGVETVGVASVVLTVLTVVPFVLMFLKQQLDSHFYVNWPAVTYVPTDSMNWPMFLATASWCLSGLEQAGSVVEDIKDPQRTIIGSLIPLMGLAFITYIPPIITGASVSHGAIDLSQWTTGYWAEVSYQVGGTPLKVITVAGSVLSAFGLTLSALCTSTRILSGMALTEAFPGRVSEWLSFRSARYGTYPWTLILNTALTAVFSSVLTFGALVKIDQCLYGIRVIVILISFYRIRHLYPHLQRPFRIPLDGWKLHAMMGVATASYVVLTVVSAWEVEVAILCTVVVAVAFVAAFLYCHFYRQHDFLGRVVTEFAVDSCEDDAAPSTHTQPAGEPARHNVPEGQKSAKAEAREQAD
ncbi:putative amino acid permease/transporter [Leptomonas pyrrhocoris]|uniref:Putative amino acid permease/transporter n=1 Tax=Leptomonas pyrrhocoris TaxID=157538 RepID=A0A0N0VDY9_LEPPY|nr:putative amino acid permease/transporter [Leptomonas pyrrhocoris]XP_015655411.1 putative amino acid permease/transporter [Leptomonas pyrrhocoris]KPA76971.1 putative amino acid permease/transporter [Leptomonas pyrrhocoris]KPA76972.1 putative amino acid permease/transporter [Leptomonas pyrrhocoris]|eukprot:XP_015655410.1 putative amino acid permease/transporter [Leptomonas pyrrhocoris]